MEHQAGPVAPTKCDFQGRSQAKGILAITRSYGLGEFGTKFSGDQRRIPHLHAKSCTRSIFLPPTVGRPPEDEQSCSSFSLR